VLFVNPRDKLKTKCPEVYQLLACQPMRRQGGHLRFLIQIKSNNTWSAPHKEHVFGLDPCSGFSEVVGNVSTTV